MAMELKIISPSPEGFVKEILWNADEISAEIEKKVGYYKTLVYTDEQVLEAKKDRATLNKFIAALKAKDKEIKELCLAPYDEFHKRMLEIIKQVEEPAALIDTQIKEFEDKQKADKTKAIDELFKSKGFQPWVRLEQLWNPKWLNKTCSMRQVEADLNAAMYQIGNDIFVINQQGDGVQAALAEYKRTLKLTSAIEAAQNYIAAKQAEEAEKARKAAAAQVVGIEDAEEAVPGMVQAQTPVAPAAPAQASVYDNSEIPERREIFFKVFCSKEELIALNNFLRTRGYIFRQIKNPM